GPGHRGAHAPPKAPQRPMTPLPTPTRDLRVLPTPRPCTILLQFPAPVSTPLGSPRSLPAFPPFCLHPYLCPPHALSPAPAAPTSLPPASNFHIRPAPTKRCPRVGQPSFCAGFAAQKLLIRNVIRAPRGRPRG